MDKLFCENHWATKAHGAAPTAKDGGDRSFELVPEGVPCSFCDLPAAHGPASYEKAPAVAAALDVEADVSPKPKKPSLRP